ncbi:hypothetical protein [Solibacillus silvestris]|nr:hypothetical protein [Solibacillus silvestris]
MLNFQTEVEFMAFGSIPMWFFAIVIAFAIVFILISEWNSRK